MAFSTFPRLYSRFTLLCAHFVFSSLARQDILIKLVATLIQSFRTGFIPDQHPEQTYTLCTEQSVLKELSAERQNGIDKEADKI